MFWGSLTGCLSSPHQQPGACSIMFLSAAPLYCREGSKPGLEELYLTTMDAIERLTPGDALYMIQGSAASRGEGSAGLSPGECLPRMRKVPARI